MMSNPINRYTWNQATADRLIAARGDLSQRELSRRLKARLGSFGSRQIGKLENVERETIKAGLLQAICEELSTTVEFIIYGKL